MIDLHISETLFILNTVCEVPTPCVGESGEFSEGELLQQNLIYIAVLRFQFQAYAICVPVPVHHPHPQTLLKSISNQIFLLKIDRYVLDVVVRV